MMSSVGKEPRCTWTHSTSLSCTSTASGNDCNELFTTIDYSCRCTIGRKNVVCHHTHTHVYAYCLVEFDWHNY
jgi:hypothetical protein